MPREERISYWHSLREELKKAKDATTADQADAHFDQAFQLAEHLATETDGDPEAPSDPVYYIESALTDIGWVG